MSTARLVIALAACLWALPALKAGQPASWVPARWQGGPLELVRRGKDQATAEDPAIREAIANWYDPATLGLLEGTPINCLLVTFSANAGAKVEQEQHQLVAEYVRAARAREHGIAVLGVVYAEHDPVALAAAAEKARLDGLVLDGELPASFASQLETAFRARSSTAIVIPIGRNAAPVRTVKSPLVAVEGVRPDARDLSDKGIRAGASAEPWIDSNVWLVHSFRLGGAWRPIWIDHQPNPSSEGDYVRCMADAALAGGRWIVTLDDDLRVKLLRRDSGALAAWRGMGAYLKFAEEHAEWRAFAPYGNLGIVLDTSTKTPDISEEYLNLVTRRHVPYRLILRSDLSPSALASFRAVLAVDLVDPTGSERKILLDFAENGGLVVAGPSWGNPPKDDVYAEATAGKGRVVVYKDDPPSPESVARDLLDLLQPELMGLSVFNAASGITYVSSSDSGKRVLVQLLNYAGRPVERVTIRFNGSFRTARLYTPEGTQKDLVPQATGNGRTEILIPKLAGWGAVLLE